MITVGHFFAGGGGGILASEILGHESVFALEINERRCHVITESGWFPSLHVECADIRWFDPSPWQGRMDCISAGFPCQDISCAGTGAGINGPRSGLVWQLFQAIDVIQPPIIFLENSPRIRTKGRREIIKALVERGYSWRDGTLAASHVGAGHKRNRWWCLAANADGLRKLEQERGIADQWGWTCHGITEDTNFVGFGIEVGRQPGADQSGEAGFWRTQLAHCTVETTETIIAARDFTGCYNWFPIDAGICRVVDGMADKVDRIKTCGDGQVPLQAAVAWALLAWG
jgi:DNA (cytosine-5)-methyltransferase 1